MGLSPFKNCILYRNTTSVAPNPNPANFEILRARQVAANVVALIRYPDCTNYEGLKVCVFKDTTCDELRKRKRIEPHFGEHPFSPFARFKPTDEGWNAAIRIAETI